MLEASLLVESGSLNRVLTEVSTLQRHGIELFFPGSLAGLDEVVDLRPYAAPRFFRPSRDVGFSSSQIAMELELAGVQRWEPPTRWTSDEFGSFRAALARAVPEPGVAEILFEEWLFLTQQSWLVSRLKAPFKALARAGELGIELLNPLVRRTLKEDASYVVETADRLRALGKWMAVGGPPAASLLSPIAAEILGPIAGGFLLLDPPPTSLRSVPDALNAYPA